MPTYKRSAKRGVFRLRSPSLRACFVNHRKGRSISEPFATRSQRVDYRGWAIVEQDMFPAPFDKPLPIAKRTRAYLKQIDIG